MRICKSKNRYPRNTQYDIRNTNRGFTLIELIITISMFAILTAVSAYIFRTVLLSWSSQETRSGIDVVIDRAGEQLTRDLREARAVSSINNDEIRFTQNNASYYIYYLYNANDSYPPAFSQTLYQLKKAQLSGGINGTFTYGSGDIILTEVLAPATSDISLSGNLVTIDLSCKKKDEAIRSRTRIRPRNL